MTASKHSSRLLQSSFKHDERQHPLEALRVKIRDAESRQVKNKAVYVALGVTPEGEREVPGLWIANNEGAKFWLSIMNNLKNRGLEDILIAVVDGLKGFPDAICVFRGIRPVIPTTSGHLNRGIRPPLFSGFEA